MIFLIAFGGLLAPFFVHELGHALVARVRGVRLQWAADGIRMVWVFPDGVPESVRREVAIAGFALEIAVGFALALAWGAVFLGYAVATVVHLWHYAVEGRAIGDDFTVLRGASE